MAELSKEAIILIVIVGCVVSVLIGYSIHYVFTNGFRDDQTEKDMTYEQKEYMRGVRLKNMEMLAGQARVKVPRDP
ncbi:uncharacterized protein P174DRAFT_436381 [Aspergillus novofumigatus IBT 16806]|uniref:Uncharacterized protein n=1 Tax=Aspergillus novofumigatus (strain IBT 16806) TaxID=1392255 RepID=A0A2I1CK47_ASPN1|nr:uncharacterized protein P174DRAFT_436381 [Aspergillus novofumigatus IBT 16806]PKX97978.1 hypothetical protein P174DRAFT_436381 [Aspergillus novofumigatus IBT 16806]